VLKAPPVATVYNWTGFYTASSVGGQWWDISGIYAAPPPDQHNTSGSKGIYGSHFGYQYQMGSLVLGAEAGYNSGWNGRSDLTTSLSPAVVTPGADCLGASPLPNRTCESRIKNYWSAGVKLGWAWTNFMGYGTAGYANGKVNTDTVVTGTVPPVFTSITSQNQGGWYAGVGADMFVTKIWMSDLILGLEYQHVELDTRLHVDTLPGATGVNNRNVQATDDVVRAKATFKWTP
jgi:outer membrane immunogenic protein